MILKALSFSVLAFFSRPCFAASMDDLTTPQVPAWGGTVSTSSTVDAQNRIQTLTLEISMTTFQNVPVDRMGSVKVPLPKVAQEQTFFDHISFDWNPHGHEPLMVYGAPHFDFHFYHQTEATLHMLDCSAPTTIAADLIAEGYTLPDLTMPGSCIPMMGVHAAPFADFDPNHVFDQTFIYGYYGSELTFFEPMVTLDFFLAHKNATKTLKNPIGFKPQTSSIPASYSVIYDAEKDVYRLTFSNFSQAKTPCTPSQQQTRAGTDPTQC